MNYFELKFDLFQNLIYHSIHLSKQSHQTKSQEFPEHFHSFTDVIFQFKFRLWLSDLLNRAIDSDIKVLNRESDRLNYHTLPCDRLNWHTLLNQWEDRKFTWSIIKKIVECHKMSENSCVGLHRFQCICLLPNDRICRVLAQIGFWVKDILTFSYGVLLNICLFW